MLISEAIVKPELRHAISDVNSRGMAELTQELKSGIKAGNIRPDVDVTLQARLIHTHMRGLISFTALDPGFFNATAVAEHFIVGLNCTIGNNSSRN